MVSNELSVLARIGALAIFFRFRLYNNLWVKDANISSIKLNKKSQILRRTILAPALASGLFSFAGNAEAAIITQNLNLTANLSNGWISFGYVSSSQAITITASAAFISAAFGTPTTIGYSRGLGGNVPATTSGYLLVP